VTGNARPGPPATGRNKVSDGEVLFPLSETPRGKLVQRSPLHARKYRFSLIPKNQPEQNAKTRELRRNKPVFPGGN
jgi:hypothetical protein